MQTNTSIQTSKVLVFCVNLEVLKTTTTTNTNLYHPNMAIMQQKIKMSKLKEHTNNCHNRSLKRNFANCSTAVHRSNPNDTHNNGRQVYITSW
jgi:hypothetical protein